MTDSSKTELGSIQSQLVHFGEFSLMVRPGFLFFKQSYYSIWLKFWFILQS